MAARATIAGAKLDRRTLLSAALLVLAGAPSVMGQAQVTAELVMFVEPGCPWCRRWDEEVGPGFSRSAEARRAPLRRIHIAEARRSGLKLSAPVNVTPTFVLVDGGMEIGRITGYPGSDFFWGMLEGLLARLPQAPAAPVARDAGLHSPANGRQGDHLVTARNARAYV